MVSESMKRLEWLTNKIPSLIENQSSDFFNHRSAPGKWSRRQILGHLIDSATNNHQRFVRAQFEEKPFITYDQDQWNLHSHYEDMDPMHILRFWTIYNQHLIEVVKRFPEDALQRKCLTEKEVTLEWLIEDYVVHLEHHLRQLVDY